MARWQPPRIVLVLRIAVVLCGLLLAPRAQAAMMMHHDLCSLFLVSDAVVKAERLGERELGPYEKVTSFRVVHSWRGPLSAGERFEIAGPSPYRYTDPFASGPEPKLDDVMVLFLQSADASQRERLQAGWLVVPSGLRVVLDGRVHRFEQHNNPGPYVAVPQGRDPEDVTGRIDAGDGLTMRPFEAELVEAERCAEEVRAALRSKEPARLVAALGPPLAERRRGAVTLGLSFFSDVAAMRILEQLDRAGDLVMFLEGVSRVHVGLQWHGLRRLQPSDAALIGAAGDAAQPDHRRIAALKVLARPWRGEKVTEVGPALALLNEAEPTIRAAAVSVLAQVIEPAQIRPAIAKRWKTEADPAVQVALLKAASRLEIVGELERKGRPDVVVAVHRDHDVVTIEQAWFGAERWSVAEAKLLLGQGGEVVRTIDLTGDGKMGSWWSVRQGGAQRRIPIDPSVEPGTYDVTVALRLEKYDPAGAVDLSRSLGRWTLQAPSRDEPAPSPSGSASASVPVSAEPDPPVASKPRSSCGCALPGGAGRSPLSWLAVAILGLACAARRSSRAADQPSASA